MNQVITLISNILFIILAGIGLYYMLNGKNDSDSVEKTKKPAESAATVIHSDDIEKK